jgi:hypothetical protein
MERLPSRSEVSEEVARKEQEHGYRLKQHIGKVMPSSLQSE